MTEILTKPPEGWTAFEDRYQVPSYSKWPRALTRAKGCHVWDEDEKRYLDLYGGHCVTLIGHSHPVWVQAIRNQLDQLAFYSNVAASPVRADYQQALIEFAGDPFSQVFLCNSGAEANETALKMALKATGRDQLLALDGGFHGRTAAALSVTMLGKYRKQFPQVVFDVSSIPFGDLDAAAEVMARRQYAALIMEPIQSMAGVRMAPQDYYTQLESICRETGTLLIFDEIQTGLGRLGTPFAAQRFEVSPDLITAAKGLGNGIPMAAVLSTKEVAGRIEKGELGTTFGGSPLACAAGHAVLRVLQDENLAENARRLEEYARETLVKGPVLGVRGSGLLLGLETTSPASEVCKFLRERQILTGTSSDPHVVRLMPPLIIDKSHLDELAIALEEFRGSP